MSYRNRRKSKKVDRLKERADRLEDRGLDILDNQEEGKMFATEKRGHRKLDKAEKLRKKRLKILKMMGEEEPPVKRSDFFGDKEAMKLYKETRKKRKQ
tara:strand:- start:736 stop:1029 length:294 start_codon:yes stop_codon:yes gene_type:complete